MTEQTFEDILKEDFFHFEMEKMKALKLEFFKKAFEHHFNDCPEYNRYCKLNNVSPSDIQTYSDLMKIQPVPSDAFRDSAKLILSVPEDKIVTILTTSSTTSPNPVKFALDKATYNNMVRMNGVLWRIGHDLDKNNLGSLFFLAPRPSESDTGLVKGGWLSFKDMGFKDEDIHFCFENGKMDEEKVVEAMKNAKRPINTYGPPFAYMPIISVLSNKPAGYIGLDENSRIITTGGWKGVKHDITKEELMQSISGTLGVDLEQIRDGYGSTDILTMLPECSHHRKHLPCWDHVSIRDPEDVNKELPSGEEGLVVLMASWINSYPAFCMTGDLGKAQEGVCGCGRVGQTVEITGRAKGAGTRGCAIKLEQFMDVISKKK